MPYSEVGDVSANAARLVWNTQYQELYDAVETLETEGFHIMRMTADADPDTLGDIGLGFSVVSGSKYFYRAQVIWVPTTGDDNGIWLGVAGGGTNGGDSANSISPASATTVRYMNTRANDTLLAPTDGAPNNGPTPSIALLVGFHRTTNTGTMQIQFRSANNVVIKAGSTVEVMRV